MKKRKRTGLWVGLLLLLAVVGLLPQHDRQDSNSAAQQNAVSVTALSQADATEQSLTGDEAAEGQSSQAASETAEASDNTAQSAPETAQTSLQTLDASDIPAYSGEASDILNENKPFFTEAEYTTEAFESYSELDSLGRCGVAYANVCKEIMPTEERGAIGMIRPSGWHTVKYDCVDGRYLYNRCHLIGYQLSGENANEKNLITGTRYLNVTGMLPYEDQVADYVHDTDKHVLYRVTPVFTGDNLVADGVEIEASSVEDRGASLQFHVFCYNVQPGVTIDYATGDSHLTEDGGTAAQSNGSGKEVSGENTASVSAADTQEQKETTYVLNKNTHKFHYPSCSSADDIKPKNRKEYTGTRDEVIGMGYDPCKRCNP